jgi:DNA-directed RNA polymerase subunit RPC12/RpoP
MTRVQYYCGECKSFFKKIIKILKQECPICGSGNTERKENE